MAQLGTVPYRDGVALQEELRERRQAGEIADLLLVLEHPPVYTKGRRTEPGDLPMGEDWYRAQGIGVCETDRGGRVTYHGPGQLVAYPIMEVDRVADFVHTMEGAIVAALADEGIVAEPRDTPFTGVWVGDSKIASIGVRVSGGVSTHGLAVNVDNDLQPFEWIVPCGIDHVRVTSVSKETSRGHSLPCFRKRMAWRFAEAFGMRQRIVSGRRLLERPRVAGMSTRSRTNPGGGKVLELMGEVRPFRERKPAWFKRPAPGGPAYRELRGMIESEGLHTVCQEAACPNIGECWERGTATFMILGDTCTRRCGFCNVKTGKPTFHDPLEPLRVAQSVKRMGLRHAVITSVDRDDLPDLGASAFVGVIRSIRRMAPGCKVEVLTPDFRGEEMPLARVIAERPDVFNHNVETVPRLYPLARRGSRFLRSCRVLRNAKEMGGDEVVTKSGLMTGLGETKEELLETFGVLREHGVQVLTVGQYLRPTRDHLPVVRYWHPDEFAELEREAYAMGFESVAAGPLVRSSYHAEQTLAQASSAG